MTPEHCGLTEPRPTTVSFLSVAPSMLLQQQAVPTAGYSIQVRSHSTFFSWPESCCDAHTVQLRAARAKNKSFWSS